MDEAPHDDKFVKDLFDRMGPTYAVTNIVSSFGFSEFWRRACIKQAQIKDGASVCDMMAGSGECWRHIQRDVTKIVSIDFSDFMSQRQKERRQGDTRPVDVRCENATSTSLDDNSVDHVVSAFGLKTLSDSALEKFADEVFRVLKPGGTYSLLEISVPGAVCLRVPYMCYLTRVIPWLGKIFLGDIECYRLLGVYTGKFDSCAGAASKFVDAGLSVEFRKHFFGCATSISGTKLQARTL